MARASQSGATLAGADAVSDGDGCGAGSHFWLISERISGEISELTKRVSENLQQLESALQQNRRTRQFLQGQGDGGGTLLNGEMWGCVGGMFSTALGAIANGLILLVMRRMLYVEDGLNESPHPRQ